MHKTARHQNTRLFAWCPENRLGLKLCLVWWGQCLLGGGSFLEKTLKDTECGCDKQNSVRNAFLGLTRTPVEKGL